jgi:hypothetical protein
MVFRWENVLYLASHLCHCHAKQTGELIELLKSPRKSEDTTLVELITQSDTSNQDLEIIRK